MGLKTPPQGSRPVARLAQAKLSVLAVGNPTPPTHPSPSQPAAVRSRQPWDSVGLTSTSSPTCSGGLVTAARGQVGICHFVRNCTQNGDKNDRAPSKCSAIDANRGRCKVVLRVVRRKEEMPGQKESGASQQVGGTRDEFVQLAYRSFPTETKKRFPAKELRNLVVAPRHARGPYLFSHRGVSVW